MKLNDKKIKLLIFDFDGLIADTEPLWAKVKAKTFKQYGFKTNKKMLLDLISLSQPHKQKYFNKIYNNRLPNKLLAKIEKQEIKMVLNIIGKKPKKYLKPYVEQALKYLKQKNIKMIIASGSNLPEIKWCLNKWRIIKYFDEIFSTNDKVKNGKPSPDIYWFICKHYNIKPKQCVVFEDSLNGVKASSLANCNTIMIPDLIKPNKDFTKTYKFIKIKSFKDIKKVI